MSHLVKTQTPDWHAWSLPHPTQTPPSEPHARSSAPPRQAPSGSRQPEHGPATQVPRSQRCPLSHVPQNWRAGPHASMPLLGAQLPSGKQHEEKQVQTGGPASITPASITTTGTASHFAIAQRSLEVHRAQTSPPIPHSSLEVPSTQSVADAQQPLQVELSQGR